MELVSSKNMSVGCVICQDLFSPSEHAFNIPCGHVFHLHCIIQWHESSNKCPQCRETFSAEKMQRLYFNFSSSASVLEENSTLRRRVESLEFHLLSKEEVIKHYVSQAEIAMRDVPGLRKEIGELENAIQWKDWANYLLNEQVKVICEYEEAVMEDKQREIERLEREVLLCGNELDAMEKRRIKLTTVATNIYEDVCSLTKERNALADELIKPQHLEQQLAICEMKRLHLTEERNIYENVEESSDKEDETAAMGAAAERQKPKYKLLPKLYTDLETVPVARKFEPASKNECLRGSPIVIGDEDLEEIPEPVSGKQYAVGSPIVSSNDSPDEGASSSSTRLDRKEIEEVDDIQNETAQNDFDDVKEQNECRGLKAERNFVMEVEKFPNSTESTYC